MPEQTILVVSPNKNQLKLILDCLEKSGYQVLVADRGQGALETIHKRRPDLALLDWRLPDLSSLALIRMIRSDEETTKLPIILWGMEMKGEDLMMGFEAGADVCLKEPFHPSVFIARVRSLLRRCYA